MVKFMFLVVLAVASACTPHQHRVYQHTLAAMSTVAFACDTSQTISALRHDPLTYEGNFLIHSRNPSNVMMVGSSVMGSAVAWGIPHINDIPWIPEYNHLPEVAVSVLSTAWFMVEASVVWRNNMASRSAERCGF